MSLRNSFQIRTYVILLISLGLVVTLGLWGYNNLTGIVETVSEAGRQDTGYLLVKEMLADISDAESSVKSYSLIPEERYLEPYNKSLENVEGQLERIRAIYAEDSRKAPLADSLYFLVGMKMSVLDEIIQLQEGSRVTGVLDEVREKVDRAKVRTRKPGYGSKTRPEEIEEQDEPAETVDPWVRATLEAAAAEGEEDEKSKKKKDRNKEKKGFLGRIFGKKDDPDSTQVAEDTVVADAPEESDPETQATEQVDPRKIQEETRRDLQNAIRREITLIRSKTLEEEQLEVDGGLALVRDDERINDRIRQVVDQIEALQTEETTQRTSAASEKVSQTNQIVVGFTIFAAIFLLMLGFAIWDFIRKNNRYQNAMEAARKATERLARSRERFLANMSHEVRTPMNAILGFSEQLMQSELKPKQSEQIRIVRDSSAHLLELLNSILDYSRLESNKIQPEEIPFSLDDLLATVVGIMRASAERAGIEFRFEAPAHRGVVLLGDPIRLRQILFNLLSNAIKFTPKGEVGLRVSSRRGENGRHNLTIQVFDTGIGIPEDRQEIVFQAFEQSESSTQRLFGGTGLGLAISKQLVELLGGSIGLESQLGKGTTFTIRMPFQEGNPADLPEQAPVATDPVLKGKRVLVADDEDYNRKLMGAILSKWKMEYVLVGDGEAALEELSQSQFDLVILDFRMPGKRGDEVAAVLLGGGLATPADTPVVAMTAATHPDELSQLKEAGVTIFLPKPFREENLRTLFGELWGDLPDAPVEDGLPEDSSEDDNGYSLEPIRRLTHGNEGFMREMLETFDKSARQGMVEIDEALAGGNLDKVGDLSHKMVPPTRHLKAQKLTGLLKSMEMACKEGAGREEVESLNQEMKTEMQQLLEFLQPHLTNA